MKSAEDFMGAGGGYILAPCHNIGSDVPPENTEALYAAAQEYGRYPIQLDDVLKPEDRQKPTAEQIASQAAPAKRERRPRRARR